MNQPEKITNKITGKEKTKRLAKMGMLVAISIVLVSLIHFPIFPAAPYLEYDPADIPILIGTFAFGPVAGLLLVIITSVIQGVTVSAAGGIYGILMHIVATGTFVLSAGIVYRKHKTRKRALWGLILGILLMTAVMVPANLFVTPYFLGVPRGAIVPVLPFIIGFNLVKGTANGLVTFFLYKRISRFLHR